MLSTIGALVFGLQVGTIFARPAAQLAPISYCNEDTSYSYTNTDSHTVDGTPFVGGLLCAGDGSCTTSLTETYSVSTTITFGGSFTLDIDEVFHAGVDVSVAQTTGTAVGEGGSDQCPQGGWECALAVTPYLTQITGTVTPTDCSSDNGVAQPYTVTSPNIDTDGNAIVSVALCSCPDFDGWADDGAPQPCPGPCKS